MRAVVARAGNDAMVGLVLHEVGAHEARLLANAASVVGGEVSVPLRGGSD